MTRSSRAAIWFCSRPRPCAVEQPACSSASSGRARASWPTSPAPCWLELPVPLLLNDRADVALAVGAAGVHLGPDDVPVAIVRRISPPGFLIGASVGSPREIDHGRGADYWGVGPWARTATKGDAGQPIGADGFQRVARLAEGKPCIAIGGVQPEDVPAVIGAHGAGVAVVSGILAGNDVESQARAYASALSRLATRD